MGRMEACRVASGSKPRTGGFDPRPRSLIVRYVPPDDDDGYGYWAALADVWGSPGIIVNVEHDMEYSDRLALALVECPAPLCTHAYRMHHIPRFPAGFWAHSLQGLVGSDWIAEGMEWAAWSAIGFCKIAPELRTAPVARSPWQMVEGQVNAALRAAGAPRWHVHWPGVEHYHYAD